MTFRNNSDRVLSALSERVAEWLGASATCLQATIREISRVDTGQTRDSYVFQVEPGEDSARMTLGSAEENALYEEYGTGEYALNGEGRKGGWVYPTREGGYAFTRGKSPNLPMTRSWQEHGQALQPLLEKSLKQL